MTIINLLMAVGLATLVAGAHYTGYRLGRWVERRRHH